MAKGRGYTYDTQAQEIAFGRGMGAAAELVCENGPLAPALLSVLLPYGGAVLALVEGYFDESYGTASENILCVAGYLMTAGMARRLDREWQAVLRGKGLPYFRMSACAHGNDPFDKISKPDRIAIQTKMIELIKRRTIKGLAVTVNLDEYDQCMIKTPLVGAPYTFCVHVIIGGVINWLSESGFRGDVAYFFEAGHKSQGETENVMRAIFRNPKLRAASHYAAHAFVEKRKARPVQAADLLAWQWYTDKRRKFEGKKRRADCESLMEHPHQAVHISVAKMLAMNARWESKSLPPLSSNVDRFILGDDPSDG